MFAGLQNYSRPSSGQLETGIEQRLTALDDRRAKAAFRNYARVPNRVSPAMAAKEAQRAGNLAAQTKLQKDWSRHALRSAGEIVKQYETGAAHQQQMMQLNRQFAQIGAKHGRAALNFDTGMTQTQEGFNGYEMAFRGSTVSIGSPSLVAALN